MTNLTKIGQRPEKRLYHQLVWPPKSTGRQAQHHKNPSKNPSSPIMKRISTNSPKKWVRLIADGSFMDAETIAQVTK